MFILFIFCECLLVVHLLASLVNSIHRNLLCQVAKLLSVVQHTVSVVSGLVVAIVVGPVRVVTIVGPVRVVTIVAPVRVVAIVVGLVRVVAIVVGLVVAPIRVVAIVVGRLVVAVVVGRLVVAPVRVVAIVVALVVAIVVAPGSHAILITGIFEGVVQRRRSVEIIISLVGVCLIIHLV